MAIGLAVGWLIAEALRRIEDPMVEIVLSVVTGYAAYLPADRLGLSGVLAAVAAGLLRWAGALPSWPRRRRRLLGYSFWEVLVYLLNAVLFVLVGLQLHPDPERADQRASAAGRVGQAALVSARW